VLLILIVVGGLIYARVTAMPSDFPPGSPPAAAGSDQTGSSGVSAAAPPPSVDAQTEEIRRAAESAQPVQVSMRLNEAQINDLIAEQASPGGPLSNARVMVRGPDLLLGGTTQWAGRQVYLTVGLTPRAEQGGLALRVDSVRAGNFYLPGSVVARVQQDIDRAMARSPALGDRVQVEDVSIYAGELIVSGHTLPR
jgi:hypothetical protein